MSTNTPTTNIEASELINSGWQLNGFDWLVLILLIVVIVLMIGLLAQRSWVYRKTNGGERRPIYWNLIIFAFIAGLFSVIAMLLVAQGDRNGIALLFLGMIGGYAVSIKELDLAKIELEKVQLEHSVKYNQGDPDQRESNDLNEG